MNRSRKSGIGIALVVATCLALSACGGGGGSSPPSAPPPNPGGGITGTGAPLSASGSMAVAAGAITVNGARLDTSGATLVVRIDDRAGTVGELRDGMIGKVRGRINDDRLNGTAERIEIENELRGAVQSVNAAAVPQSLVVNGQTIYVDGQTVYANLTPASLSGITVSANVEVHGLRDSNGSIRATRIEGKAAVANDDEIRGTISAVQSASSTFTLGTAPNAVTVNYAGATFTTGNAASLAAGIVVEVHGSFSGGGIFNAIRIDFEELEDDSFAPSGSDVAEVEGFVSGFTSLASTFKVGTRTVQVSGSTRYENGSAADLADDVRVEAEGTVNASGVLIATEVQFKQTRVMLQGVASAVAANSLTVLGMHVDVNSLTRVDTRTAGGANSTSLADIVPGADCVEVRAVLDGTAIVASEVKEQSSGGSCKAIVQARVTAKDDAARTLVMLGITVNLSGGGVTFRDANENAVSAVQFFAAVTASANSGTLVKAKGSFSGASLLTGEEAELEN